jgi:hypothetical protein
MIYNELINEIDVVKNKGKDYLKNEVKNKLNGSWDLWKRNDCVFMPDVQDIITKLEIREGELYYHRNGVNRPLPINELEVDVICSLVYNIENFMLEAKYELKK